MLTERQFSSSHEFKRLSREVSSCMQVIASCMMALQFPASVEDYDHTFDALSLHFFRLRERIAELCLNDPQVDDQPFLERLEEADIVLIDLDKQLNNRVSGQLLRFRDGVLKFISQDFKTKKEVIDEWLGLSIEVNSISTSIRELGLKSHRMMWREYLDNWHRQLNASKEEKLESLGDFPYGLF